MIIGYGIVLEDDILFYSNEKIYSSFEIVLFIEKLITSINPTHKWRLNHIYLNGPTMGKERMVIKHEFTEDNENLFFCVDGKFKSYSQEVYKMLSEFYDMVNIYYKSIDLLVQASKKAIFKEIIETTTQYLWDKYEKVLADEKNILLETVSPKNTLLYCGISAQGLPIISQLYDTSLLNHLNKEIDEENIELYNSNISAKLATIAMNTLIRAKTSIKEIYIEDLDDKENMKIILFGDINGYSVDIFACGDFLKVKENFKKFLKKLSEEEILKTEFSGDLKPYLHLRKYLDDLAKDFD